MHFSCRIVAPPHLYDPRALDVVASSYAQAARVHVRCNGPRRCLVEDEVVVDVTSSLQSVRVARTRRFRVALVLSAMEIAKL
jgi:hypothetical protein